MITFHRLLHWSLHQLFLVCAKIVLPLDTRHLSNGMEASLNVVINNYDLNHNRVHSVTHHHMQPLAAVIYIARQVYMRMQ